MHKNEHRFRDAIMPDVVTDGTKRLSRYLMGGIKIESLFFAVVSYHRIGYLFEKREMP